jgi:hypothetical protein
LLVPSANSGSQVKAGLHKKTAGMLEVFFPELLEHCRKVVAAAAIATPVKTPRSHTAATPASGAAAAAAPSAEVGPCGC